MSNKRIILALLMSVILLATSFNVFASADPNVSYSATSVGGKKGDTVTVTVRLSSTVDIWGANVMLQYNSSELEFVKCEMGNIVSTGSLHNTGSSVNYSGMFSGKSGTVFTVKFKILKSTGASVLKLTSTENIDENGVGYNCSVINGKVTVIDNAAVIGDANGDEKITAVDARMVLQHVASIKTLSEAQSLIVDLNCDGSVTAVDARMILQKVAGLI